MTNIDNRSRAEILMALPADQRAKLTGDVDPEVLRFDWSFFGRPKQFAPPTDPANPWSNWLVLAGRGFGKTRTGAEWVRQNM
jgi:phage terminase large subunit-like protein